MLNLNELPRLRFEMYVDDDVSGAEFLVGKIWFIESINNVNERHMFSDPIECKGALSLFQVDDDLILNEGISLYG